MDINILRSTVTLLSFALFIGLMAWAWWPARKSSLKEAANLPFSGEMKESRDE
jgi:cytochrome c oxidase cbb3-type subunit IV